MLDGRWLACRAKHQIIILKVTHDLFGSQTAKFAKEEIFALTFKQTAVKNKNEKYVNESLAQHAGGDFFCRFFVIHPTTKKQSTSFMRFHEMRKARC